MAENSVHADSSTTAQGRGTWAQARASCVPQPETSDMGRRKRQSARAVHMGMAQIGRWHHWVPILGLWRLPNRSEEQQRICHKIILLRL